jgi:hypothetical protein
MDKLKGAVNAVTGGAAEVTIDFDRPSAAAGETIEVRVSCRSKGAEVKSQGVFVDLRATETIRYKEGNENKTQSSTTIEQTFQIAPPLVLAPNDGKEFRGTIQIPASVLPSYTGRQADHAIELRGRLEARGNDPDSGFKPFTVR